MEPILDACCGSRMFYFDKENPNVLFCDIRKESHILSDGRSLIVSPDLIMDFTNMPFEDESFYHVVFDPPHLKNAGENGWQGKKYGILPNDWKPFIKEGINECMRVLKPGGTLIFKWNEEKIKVSEILKSIDHAPIYGHRTLQSSKTIWMAFIKMPKTHFEGDFNF